MLFILIFAFGFLFCAQSIIISNGNRTYKLLTKSDVILSEDLRKDKNLVKGVNYSFMILFKFWFWRVFGFGAVVAMVII